MEIIVQINLNLDEYRSQINRQDRSFTWRTVSTDGAAAARLYVDGEEQKRCDKLI